MNSYSETWLDDAYRKLTWRNIRQKLGHSSNHRRMKKMTPRTDKLRALPCGLLSTEPRASVPARGAPFVPTSLTCGCPPQPPRPPQKHLIVNCPLNDSLESKREAPISWPGMGEREGGTGRRGLQAAPPRELPQASRSPQSQLQGGFVKAAHCFKWSRRHFHSWFLIQETV